ncbi:MAG: hypothetical protein ACOX4F_08255 [Atopobiaceae bacterium]|jgi:hypothetical protein
MKPSNKYLSSLTRVIREVSSAKRTQSGQMSVELAALIPVVIVVALIVYNLGSYVQLCSEFDRVAYNAVVFKGVSAQGEQSLMRTTAEVQETLEESFAQPRSCEVKVVSENISPGDYGSTFVISPFLTRYTCTFSYRVWPSSFVLAGVAFSSPFELTHSRSLVVDRYRAGVVI